MEIIKPGLFNPRLAKPCVAKTRSIKMKKLNLIFAVFTAIAFGLGQAHAATVSSGTPVNFAVTASVPQANGVSISAIEVNAADNKWGSEVNALDFNVGGTNQLDYDSENGIWTSDHYYAINVGIVGGAGSISTNVKYVQGATPTGQTRGLGFKSTAKFVKVAMVNNEESETDLSAGTRILQSLVGSGVTVAQSDISGGYLRIYVGLYDGADAAINGQGGEPFTNADRPGTYNGTLTITSTVS